jgi:hypothetical protein
VEGSIPFTRSNKYGLFLTFAGFCISFASARRFPPPEMRQTGWLANPPPILPSRPKISSSLSSLAAIHLASFFLLF